MKRRNCLLASTTTTCKNTWTGFLSVPVVKRVRQRALKQTQRWLSCFGPNRIMSRQCGMMARPNQCGRTTSSNAQRSTSSATVRRQAARPTAFGKTVSTALTRTWSQRRCFSAHFRPFTASLACNLITPTARIAIPSGGIACITIPIGAPASFSMAAGPFASNALHWGTVTKQEYDTIHA